MREIGESSYRRFLQEDPEALEELIRTYSDALVRYAFCYVKNSAAAEDIMEEAFVCALLRRKQLAHPDQLKAYLYKTVRNRSVDYLRCHRREVPICDVEHILVCPDAESAVVRGWQNTVLYARMQSLPAQYREVLELSCFEDFSVDQICRIMDKRPKQVYNLLARAKVALRTLLEKEGFTREDLF